MKARWIGLLFIGIFLISFCAEKKMPVVSPPAISWITNLDSALVLAGQQNKILMIDFMAEWCPPCHMMEDSTFNQPALIEKTQAFIPVRIDVDKQGDIANHYNCNANKYGGIGIPNLLFLDQKENRLAHLIGFQTADRMIAVIDSVLTAETK